MKTKADSKFLNYLASEIDFPHTVLNKSTGQHSPIKNHPENMKALFNHLKLNIRFNEIKYRIYFDNNPVSNQDLALLINHCNRHNLNSTAAHIDAVLEEVGLENKYHPFKEAVESKKWDGKDRFDELFNTMGVNPDFSHNSELYRLYLRRWLIGVVAKVYRPGEQNMVLTLQGLGGIGKNRWFEKMKIASGIFSEGQINTNSKDDRLKHAYYVIHHISELDGVTRKQDKSAIKSYITLTHINERAAYGRYPIDALSSCSFAASVNDDKFLDDPTGTRRFLVIPLTSLNADHNVDMQQVFAQAHHICEINQEKWWFDPSELVQINSANEDHEVADRVSNLVSRLSPGIYYANTVQISDIMQVKSQFHKGELSSLGQLLSKRGIQSKRLTKNGVKMTVYGIDFSKVGGDILRLHGVEVPEGHPSK